MSTLRYNDHYIHVFLTPDKSGNAAYIPVVEIRYKQDNKPITRLLTNEAFTSEQDAKACGFKLAKKMDRWKKMSRCPKRCLTEPSNWRENRGWTFTGS